MVGLPSWQFPEWLQRNAGYVLATGADAFADTFAVLASLLLVMAVLVLPVQNYFELIASMRVYWPMLHGSFTISFREVEAYEDIPLYLTQEERKKAEELAQGKNFFYFGIESGRQSYNMKSTWFDEQGRKNVFEALMKEAASAILDFKPEQEKMAPWAPTHKWTNRYSAATVPQPEQQ